MQGSVDKRSEISLECNKQHYVEAYVLMRTSEFGPKYEVWPEFWNE